MESIKVAGEEYEKQYFPFGGFLFIRKDMPPTKTGRLYTPPSVRESHAKWSSTGIVVRKSKFRVFEDAYEEYIWTILKRGDRIGYNTTVPFYAPSPPHYEFQGDDKEVYQTIHLKDVVGVICESEQDRISFSERF